MIIFSSCICNKSGMISGLAGKHKSLDGKSCTFRFTLQRPEDLEFCSCPPGEELKTLFNYLSIKKFPGQNYDGRTFVTMNYTIDDPDNTTHWMALWKNV